MSKKVFEQRKSLRVALGRIKRMCATENIREDSKQQLGIGHEARTRVSERRPEAGRSRKRYRTKAVTGDELIFSDEGADTRALVRYLVGQGIGVERGAVRGRVFTFGVLFSPVNPIVGRCSPSKSGFLVGTALTVGDATKCFLASRALRCDAALRTSILPIRQKPSKNIRP